MLKLKVNVRLNLVLLFGILNYLNVHLNGPNIGSDSHNEELV